MITTPFAAAEPYNADADASLSTCIDSISAGLISATEVNWIPSTTNKGSLEPKVLKPRIRIFAPAPGTPEEVTVTPAARPCNKLSMFGPGFAVMSLTFTTATAPVTSFLRCAV